MSLLTEKGSITKRVSRCMYCNSTSYGRGCRYSPHGVHFHPDDPKKCAYCGSTSYGRGCQMNPTSNIHQHGINYNSMFNENISKLVHNTFLLKELSKPIVEYTAYKLGIINQEGHKIKEPVTEQEQAAYSPAIKTILKIKRYLGSKIDLINQTSLLEHKAKTVYNKENHQKLLVHEEKINAIINQLHEATQAALDDGLSFEQVETLIN